MSNTLTQTEASAVPVASKNYELHFEVYGQTTWCWLVDANKKFVRLSNGEFINARGLTRSDALQNLKVKFNLA
jgi:hypothetical protein